MTTDTTGAALLAIIRANPADWDARRVYADWLDDGSEEGAMRANGMRWQAANEKYPISLPSFRQRGDGHSWLVNKIISNHTRIHGYLPLGLYRSMTGFIGRGSCYKEYPTPDAAEAALARALWALGIQAQ